MKRLTWLRLSMSPGILLQVCNPAYQSRTSTVTVAKRAQTFLILVVTSRQSIGGTRRYYNYIDNLLRISAMQLFLLQQIYQGSCMKRRN